MFPHALNDGVPGSLIVATLDVEVAQQRLEDQAGQERNPCLQQIDECGVGAELFEDFLGSRPWKNHTRWDSPSGKMTAPNPLSTVP